MPDAKPSSRLVDQFRATSVSCHLILSARLQEVGFFGDLVWSPTGLSAGRDGLMTHMRLDPAFIVVGNSRWLAFDRLNEEIRYYAAPLHAGTDVAKGAERDPARLAAIAAEANFHERGVLPTVDDAVSLTDAYLSGQPLADIRVKRIVRYASNA
jgi:hypothetical protein